jgi:hypothetical protein
MRRSLHSHIAALLLLSVIAGGFWLHRVHLDPPERSDFIGLDMAIYFYPASVYLHRQLRSGNLPLWNPYQMAGTPFLAVHQPGALYPPTIALLTAMPPALAMQLHAVLHIALAGFFTWLFASQLGLGRTASLAASLSFMLSGAVLLRIYNMSYLSTIAWLPGIVWALHGLLSTTRLRWALALAGVIVLAFLGGFSQGFLFEVQFAAAYALAGLFLVTAHGRRLRALALLGLSGGLAAGLAAAQTLPTLELASTRRPGDYDLGWGVATLTLPLLLCGLADRRRFRYWAFFTTASLVAGLFMLGERTPIFRIYHSLPLGDLFRFPFRIGFVYAFGMSILIGIGIQGATILVRRLHPAAVKAAAGLGVVLTLGIAAELYARGELDAALSIASGETRYAPDELIEFLAAHREEGRVFIENFQELGSSELPSLLGTVNQLGVVPTYEPLVPGAYATYFGQGPRWRGFLHTVGKTRLPWFGPGLGGHPGFEPARLLDLMSVRYYATHAGITQNRRAELQRFTGGAATTFGSVVVFERAQALPRAYAVHEVVVEPDAARALPLLRSSSFDPRRRAVVDREPPATGEAQESGDRVEIVSYAPDEVGIDAHCATACLLVLTDLHYPGWEAHVDGETATLFRVNTLFRGVHLSAGRHTIVHRYRPRSFRVGAWISVSTLALVALVALLRVRREPLERRP